MTIEEGVSEQDKPEATLRKTRGLPWRALTLGFVGATLLLALGLWALRSTILTTLVTNRLEERGVRCDALSLEASALLGEVSIAPTRCEVLEGAIAEVRWDEPVLATIDAGAVATVTTPALRITRRVRPEEAAASALGDLMQAPERVGAVLFFASRLSQIESPAMSVDRVEVVREGDETAELTLTTLAIPARAAPAPVVGTIDELALATARGPLGIEASPRMTAVVIRAEATRGSLEGDLDTSVRLPMLGTLSLGNLVGPRRLVVTVEELDQAEPRWNIETRP